MQWKRAHKENATNSPQWRKAPASTWSSTRHMLASQLGTQSGCYERAQTAHCASAKADALPFPPPPFHLAPRKDPFNPLQTNTACPSATSPSRSSPPLRLYTQSPQKWLTSTFPSTAARPSRPRVPSSLTSSAAAARSSRSRSAGRSVKRTSQSAVVLAAALTDRVRLWVLHRTATMRAATSRGRSVYPSILSLCSGMLT
jgi:hypothetical protein